MGIRIYNNGKESQNVIYMITSNDCCWYSYTHGKYYCRLSHEYQGIDYLHSYATQEQFLYHVNKHHKMDLEKFVLPEQNVVKLKNAECRIE